MPSPWDGPPVSATDASRGDPGRRLRIYGSLRTAHLERLPLMVPARMWFTATRRDFDESLVDPTNPPQRKSRRQVLQGLWREQFDVVELNEPAMVDRWPFLLACVAVIRSRSLLRRHRCAVVSYCIENADPAAQLRQRRPMPPKLAALVVRVVMGVLVRQSDRLAFGTTGSLTTYEQHVAARALSGRARTFEAVPGPCGCEPEPGERRDPTEVVSLGAFVERKGIRSTMAAWDVLRVQRPEATLCVIGTGPLQGEVERWAATRPEVTLHLDPPRAEVHRALRTGSVLVLPSQRHGYWREQIGLPVLEALSHGCEVVTTTETGLADWLVEHGHQVVAPDAPAEELAAALARALDRAATREGSSSELPAQDQRLAADRWLMTGSDAPD